MTRNSATDIADLLEGLPSRIHEAYAPFVAQMPDHTAFVEGGRTWTYRQFAEAVNAAAASASRTDSSRIGFHYDTTLWPAPGSEDTELRCLMEQEWPARWLCGAVVGVQDS